MIRLLVTLEPACWDPLSPLGPDFEVVSMPGTRGRELGAGAFPDAILCSPKLARSLRDTLASLDWQGIPILWVLEHPDFLALIPPEFQERSFTDWLVLPTSVEEVRARVRRLVSQRSQTIPWARLMDCLPFLVSMKREGCPDALYLNSSGYRMCGVAPEPTPTSLDTHHFHPPEALNFLRGPVAEEVKRQGFWSGRTEMLHRDGTRIPVLQTIVRHHYQGATYYLTLAQDLRDLDALRGALASLDARYKTLFENTGAMTALMSREGMILHVNSNVANVTGREREAVENHMNLCDLLVPEDRSRLQQRLHQPDLDMHLPRDFSAYRLAHADGTERHVLCHIAEVRGSSEFVVSLVDVTRHVEQEKSLRKAQKFEALATFAGGLAHDFNNLLGSILGNTELARIQLESDSPLHEQLNGVEESTKRAAALIRQVLTIARGQEFVRALVDFKAVLQECVRQISRLKAPDIEVLLQFYPGIPKIWSEETQLHQLAFNLILNAVQAIGPKPGKVEVLCRPSSPGDFDHLFTGMGVILEVKDSGPGIPEHLADRIFDPFFTTKKLGEGTGLGLAVVQGVVSWMKGRISYESSPEEGTCFRVWLPTPG